MTRPPARSTLTATHWGTYRAETLGGRLTGLGDYEHDPDPAEIGPGLADMLEHRLRIAGPMVRKGFLDHGPASDRSRRGAEPFVAVSWDEALDLVARELDRVRTAHGNAAIFGGSYGWAERGAVPPRAGTDAPVPQLHRRLHRLDRHLQLRRHQRADPHVVGHFRRLLLDEATSWPSDRAHRAGSS